MNDFPDIPPFLDRRKDAPVTQFAKPLVYSFTMLKTADNCLHKMFRQYIKKDIPYVETPEMEWGNLVHSAFEYRLGGKPLPREQPTKDGKGQWPSMQHWEPLVAAYVERKAKPEMKLGINRKGQPTGFFGNDVYLRGKIDATLVNGNNAFLPDWKTGSSKYEDPFELEIQALMLKATMPHLTKVFGHYVWLKEDRIGQNHDLSDFSATWARVNNKVEIIEDAMASGEWTKTKNPLCGYCPVKDCENWYDAKAGK